MNYPKHDASCDKVNILFCEIKIWQPQKPSSKDEEYDWFTIPEQHIKINEVLSVEISKSYKKVIGTAIIKLPRGGVIQKFEKSSDSDSVISPFDEDNLPVNATRADGGALNVTKGTQKIVTPTDLHVGQRINIRLGYATSDKEYNEWRKSKNLTQVERVFTGWITKCSVDNPITIECEDILSILKKTKCPNIPDKKNYKVFDFFGANGTYKLLKGTGITLDSTTENTEVNIGKVKLTDNLVVANILDEWSKCGLFAFLNDNGNDKPSLRIGRVYSSYPNVSDYANILTTAQNQSKMYVISFNWDVVEDKLTVMNVDKMFLAVTATAQDEKGRIAKLTVIPQEKAGSEGEIDGFRVVNYYEPKARKSNKWSNGNKNGDMTDGAKDKADMSLYTVVPYTSIHKFTTKEALKKEAVAYYGSYNANGISGSLTVFGDVDVTPSGAVGLIDLRAQERNGTYFVESVDYKFDTNGYRKEIKIPYRVAKYNKFDTKNLDLNL